MTDPITPPMMLLSIDVEEFDLPLEHAIDIPFERQIEVSRRGLEGVLTCLAARNARATLFTTGVFARACPDLIRDAARTHEIASHGLVHSAWEDAHAAESRRVLEEIAATPVTGFRRARMGKTSPTVLLDAGYRYDSSENPTCIPGRYNNLGMSRSPRFEGRLLRVPASVTPTLRIPLFWLAFKNFPWKLYRELAQRTLDHDGFLNIYFHPWEFADLSGFDLPGYVRRPDAGRLLERLDRLLGWAGERAEFTTFSEFDRHWRQSHAQG